MDEKDNKVKTFGLDRISKIKLLESTFIPSSKFEPDIFFKYSFGITAVEQKPQKIILRFNAGQGNYIKSQPLHQSQKIIEDNQDFLLISLKLQSSPELIMQLMSFGNKVKIVEPSSLAEAVLAELKKAIKNYDR